MLEKRIVFRSSL